MSVELGVLQYSHFQPLLHQNFTLAIPELQMQVVLHEVKQLRALPSEFSRSHSFSLLFRGPLEVQLGQGCVQLEHPELGVLEHVMIVPVAKDADGFLYEAVFG